MKVMILSDSHGNDLYVAKALDREWPFDAMMHLGDTQEDEEEFAGILAGEDVPLFLVKGNCDWYSSLPTDRILELAGHRILMTHGHTHDVSYGTKELADLARENDCSIVVYGHTHRPEIDDSIPGLLILNPGSVSFPRQRGRKKSYMILELEEGKRPQARIEYLI
jgi:putative phosphoesterase